MRCVVMSGETVAMNPEGDAPLYVISVAAKLTGLPAWMLRVLDQEGIVAPTRTGKNRRLYSDNDITRLERVRYFTETRGVNMAGIKVILEMEELLRNAGIEIPDVSENDINDEPINRTDTRQTFEETEK